MELRLDRDQGGGAFAESGRPVRIAWSPDRERFALESAFEPYRWHGRNAGHAPGGVRHVLRRRIGIYEASSARCLRVFDALDHFYAHRVNDLCFLPGDRLAIACRRYGGGHRDYGYLYVWPYLDGDPILLFQQRSEVSRLGFDGPTDTLTAVVSPIDDEARGPRLRRVRLPKSAWWTATPESLDLESLEDAPLDDRAACAVDEPALDDLVDELGRIADRAGRAYEPRWMVWDLVSLEDGAVLAARNSGRLDRIRVEGSGESKGFELETKGDCVQVAVGAGRRSTALVNVHRLVRGAFGQSGTVHELDLETGKSSEVGRLKSAATLSVSRAGYVLVRDEGWAPRSESHWNLLVDPAGKMARLPDLGRSCGVHGLRIDGEHHLYCWSTAGPHSTDESPWLCRIDPDEVAFGRPLKKPRATRIERRFPRRWKGAPTEVVSCDCATFAGEGPDRWLVMACRPDRSIHQPPETLLACRDPNSGAVRWTVRLDAQVTALTSIPGRGVVVFAQNDGMVGLVRLRNGDLLHHGALRVDGMPTTALSLTTCGGRPVAGTVDGRVLVFEPV